MNFTIKIVTGEDVLTLLKDDLFISSWKNLSNIDHKVTLIQEPPFVITWYQQYYNIFNPVLCLGYDDKNSLVGLMPLALSLKSGRLTHAGDGQAEYNGWISKKDIDQIFPISCLIVIKRTFRVKKWQWRCIPPRTKTDWIFSPLLKKENIYINYTKQPSPTWNLSDENKLKEILSKKTIRYSINKYKKAGKFYIERIKDKEQAKDLIDIVKNQYDFRMLAVYNIAPFEIDIKKKNFYIERMNFPDNNHFTALWSNGKPIAFHFGACDKDTVYLGLFSFDPLEAKNSPGILLIIELATLMMKEGYKYLDLTPGIDEYKEKFSNKYQELIAPTVYFDKFERFKDCIINLLKKPIKTYLVLVGLKPYFIKKKIYKKTKSLFNTLGRINLVNIIKKLFLVIYNKRIYLQYKFPCDEFDSKIEQNIDIRIQNYSDLLLYTDSNPWLTRSDFLFEASKRFANGELLYSIVKDGSLAHYGWLTKGGRIHRFTEVDMEFKSPPESVILYDFYTEPKFRRQGLYQQNIKQLLYDSFKMGFKEAYIGVAYKNIPSKAAIEKMGFKLFRTYIKIRFLCFSIKKELKVNG